MNLKRLLGTIFFVLLSPAVVFAAGATGPITAINGLIACPTCTTASGSLTSNAVVIGGGSKAVSTISASTTVTDILHATAGAPAFSALLDADLPTTAILESDIVTGSGLLVTSHQLATDSTQTGFIASGALTCTTAQAGRMKVHSTALQYCDNSGTPTLRYAAYGTSTGDAVVTAALRSATTVVDVSAATAPSGGQVLKATDSTHATWQTLSAGASSILSFASETVIDSASTTTYYMGLGGKVSTSEADVISPVSAATIGNLRCYASGTVGGTSLVITTGVGACTAGLTYTSSPTVTVTGTTMTSQVDLTNPIGPTANQCIALKLVATGDTNPVYINCTMDRTA